MKRLLTIPALLAAAALAGPASAQIACRPWADVKADLLGKYREQPIGGGLINPMTIVQVFASIDGKTFTILLVHSTGMACIVAAGTGWEPGVNPSVIARAEGR